MDAAATHKMFEGMDMADRLRQTRQYWQEWLQPSSDKFGVNVAEEPVNLCKNHCYLLTHRDDRGSVLASGDSSIYNYGRDYYCYCWPRDACYALWLLIRLGHFDEARLF